MEKEAGSGKVTDWQFSDTVKLPIQAMELSTRAYNCLALSGCTHVEDVITLSSYAIMKMRNTGPKTASEIAHWLIDHGIVCSAWVEYL